MAEDIAPIMLLKIQKDFNRIYKSNAFIQNFLERLEKGTATQKDASLYSRELGDILSRVLIKNITAETMPDGKMLWNIISRTVDPMMRNNHKLANEAAIRVQNLIYESEGIGIKAISAKYPEGRVKAIMDKTCDPNLEFKAAQKCLGEPIANTSQSYFDDFTKINLLFAYKSGMEETVTRTVAGKACKWCQQLAGVYEYPSGVPKDVYHRHDNCKCTVTYRTQKKAQNVWSKDIWEESSDTLERRKDIGVKLDVRKNE